MLRLEGSDGSGFASGAKWSRCAQRFASFNSTSGSQRRSLRLHLPRDPASLTTLQFPSRSLSHSPLAAKSSQTTSQGRRHRTRTRRAACCRAGREAGLPRSVGVAGLRWASAVEEDNSGFESRFVSIWRLRSRPAGAMSAPAEKGGWMSSLTSSIANFGTAAYSTVNSLLGHEGLEVVNPEGGQEDVEEEAIKGRFKQEDRESYWKMMHKYIGSDITSMVTLPIIISEPMSTLQKMAEIMEYSHLLDLADECEDPLMKLVYACTWAVSVYPALQRAWKPFNPILGETYEMVNHNGISFLAEQVSHHPPMGAAHAENEHFTYDITSNLRTKFLGNSLDVFPVGRTRVLLKKSNMTLALTPPPSKAHNLIFGRTWIDSFGDMVMENLTTGDKVILYFQPCGWFGKGRYEVDGYVYDKDEEPKIMITGKWNEFLSCQPCDVEGEPIEGTELKEVWRCADLPKGDKFQYTYFAHEINSFKTAPQGLLASDSRLRPDRYALEMGDMSKAGTYKTSLEERQRVEKKMREAKQQEFSPRWFKFSGEVAPTPWGDLEVYEYNGKYDGHCKQIEAETAGKLVDVEQLKSIPFNPWQFEESEGQSTAREGQIRPVEILPVSGSS